MSEIVPIASDLIQVAGDQVTLPNAAAGIVAYLAAPSVGSVRRVLADATDHHLRNFLRIGEAAKRKDPTPDPAQTAHPRLVNDLLVTSEWLDDAVQQEYLAGLLVSSRVGGGTDYPAYLADTAKRMTSAQTRLHHMIYAATVGAGGPGTDRDFMSAEGRENTYIFLPEPEVRAILGRTGAAEAFFQALAPLKDMSLISGYGYTPTDTAPGLTVRPSALGADLFLHAYGHGGNNPNVLLEPGFAEQLVPFDPPGPTCPSAKVSART